jgi:predicted nuclease with TOPRIM domain
VLTFQFGNSTFNRLVLSLKVTKLHNVFVFCRELKLEDETDHLRKDLNAMNTRVDELKKEIKHLNIDRSKCVDEREQLSPAMEASVSTYS